MSKLAELWCHITNRVDEIKAMPDDVVININDDGREHGRIKPENIQYDDNIVWVQLNHNTRLTLFVKTDYDLVMNKARLGGAHLAQSEIAHTFDFSRTATPDTLFKDWIESY